MADAIFDDDLLVVQDEETELTDASPIITFGDGSDTVTASIFENTTSIATVTASDPDAGDSLTFSIAGGGDAAMFNIDPVTGSLAFIAGPDFETPRDVPSNSSNGGDNVYEVVVQATDAAGQFAQKTIDAAVTNADDNNPVFLSGGQANFIPGATGAAYVAHATDADHLGALTYSLAGTDANLFDIDASTGVVTFKTSPSLAAPGDADENNVYNIVAVASDGNHLVENPVSITVIDPTTVHEMAINMAQGDPGPYGGQWGMPLDYSGVPGEGWRGSFGGFGFDFSGVTTFPSEDGGPSSVALDGHFTVFAGSTIVGTGTMPAFNYTLDRASGDFAIPLGNGEWHMGIHGSPANPDNPGSPSPILGPFGDFVSGLDRVVFNGTAGVDQFDGSYFGTPMIMHGGDSNDGLYGAFQQANQIYGDAGNDAIFGQGDGDYLSGGAGNDSISDGDDHANDTFPVGAQTTFNHDTLYGGDGDDQVLSSGGGDLLDGGAGNDDLQAGPDRADDDTLIGGTGDDRINGGLGTDIAIFAGNRALYTIIQDGTQAGAEITIVGPDGHDTVVNVEFFQFDDGTFAVTDVVNQLPMITSNSGDQLNINIDENTTAVTTITAVDPVVGQTLVYSISGDDADKFHIDASTGVLSLIAAPDYEHPVDHVGDNRYFVVVEASDGIAGVDSQNIIIDVNNLNDTAPVFDSDATAGFAENATGTAYFAAATDPDHLAAPTFALSGTDAALFDIDSGTGAVTFKASPDFETPADSDGNNVYQIVVTASEGGLSTDRAVAITVTDVSEGINGTPLDDHLVGTPGNDVISGLAGHDTLQGLDGDDTLDGGPDEDRVDYSTEGGTQAVNVNFTTGVATDTFGKTDTLISIEEVVGTNQADTFVGHAAGYEGFIGLGGADNITGGSGNSWVYYDHDKDFGGDVGVNVNLSNAVASGQVAHSAIDGFGSTDSLHLINDVRGTHNSDIATGDDGDNRFQMGSGSDHVDGRGGIDDMDYSRDNDDGTATHGVFANLSDATAASALGSALAGTAIDLHSSVDTLVNMEEITGSEFGDVLIGKNAGYSGLSGLAGADTLIGNSADTWVYYDEEARFGGTAGITVNLSDTTQGLQAAHTATDGFGSTDTLTGIENVRGTAGADTIVGDAHDNFFQMGAGADTIDGGDGEDTIDYSRDNSHGGATHGVLVNLSGQVLSTALGSTGPHSAVDMSGAIDTLANVENVIGTDFADAIWGNSGSNTLIGGGGDDLIRGGAGDDILIGGAGNDTLEGDSGHDTVDYSHDVEAGATHGVIVNLLGNGSQGELPADTAIDGFGDTDSVPNVPNVIGTQFDDIIYGGEHANVLSGLAGDDLILGGAANDVVDGGAGTDTALYAGNFADYGVVSNSDGSLTITDLRAGSPEGVDTVLNIETFRFADGDVTLAQVISTGPTGPTIPGGDALAISVQENTTAVTTITATAHDPGGSMVYSITGGFDGNQFAIDQQTGALSFITAPDYENPATNGGAADQFYDVNVRATDGQGDFDEQLVTVTVTNTNDNSPMFTSASTASFAENGVGTAYVGVATDADNLDALSYSIGGADADQFNIDAVTGAVTFKEAPNFEAPTDAGGDNVYDVVVTASDREHSTNQGVAIAVTDQSDGNAAPVFTQNGHLEIAMAVTSGVRVLDVLADGSLVAASPELPSDTFSYRSSIGDVDGDGDKDVLISGDNGDGRLYLNNGDNTYSDSGVRFAGHFQSDNGLVDIDNDGDLDVIFHNGLENVDIYRNNVAAGFEEVQSIDPGRSSSGYTAADGFVAADLNGDGFTDLFIPRGDDSSSPPSPMVLLNDRTGHFVEATQTLPGESATRSVGGDVDGDGDIDLVYGGSALYGGSNPGDGAVLLNDGHGGFTVGQSTFGPADTNQIVLGDLNGDASLDVVTSSSAGLEMWRNEGTGHFTFDHLIVSGPVDDPALMDFDGDGDLDLVYVGTGSVQSMANDGHANFTAAGTPLGVSGYVFYLAGSGSAADATLSPHVAENTLAVTTVLATDPDQGTVLSYSIAGGPDAALFDLDPATGVLSFKAAPDFEAPTDSNGDNVYDLVVAASDGSLTSTQNVVVTVHNVNDNAPDLSFQAAAIFAENGIGTAYHALATDADNLGAVRYSISGTDAALFDIDAATGNVSFKASPDFEAPADANGDNIYDLVVTASDGTFATNRNVAITVTNVSDLGPVFTSADTATVAETSTATIYHAVAAEADSDAALSYSLSGVDAALFTIDAATGNLTFKAAPNFEAPADSDGDNVYKVSVTASDGTLSAIQAVDITVTNVNDNAPAFTSGNATTLAENATGTAYLAMATDADNLGALAYSLSGADAALFDIDSATGSVTFKASPNFEAPTDAGANNVYDLVVTASDGILQTTKAIAITVTNVNDNAPVVTSAAAATFAENRAGTAYHATATDADNLGTLTYGISGADAALFNVDAATGNVSFKTSPNFETPTDAGANNVYDIVVTVSDGTLQSTKAVAITVTDVAEGTTITGTAGNNTLNGTGGNDVINGLAGNDVLNGLDGNDTLSGGTGADTLDGGLGADAMRGGAGDDTYIVDNVGDVVDEGATGSSGSDTVLSSIAFSLMNSATLLGAVESLTLTGTANIDGTGNDAKNILNGNTGDNHLFGEAGNDILFGNGGNDTLDGGAGVDTMHGGSGNDTYVVDNTGDTVDDSGANRGDLDTIQASITFSLASSHVAGAIENLTLLGTANINGTGNALDNLLVGNAGNNVLDGGVGADTMQGGAGNDTYIVDNLNDTVDEAHAGSAGVDTVSTALSFSLAPSAHVLGSIENLTLTGNNDVNGTGNDLDNVLTGNRGDNILDGGIGNDTLVGNQGNDTLHGGAGHDVLSGGAGDDTLDGGLDADAMAGGTGKDVYIVDDVGDTVQENANEGVDIIRTTLPTFTTPANIENLVYTGAGSFTGTGNALNNVIEGGHLGNTLNGGAGNDTLIGHGGTDVLTGGTGNDQFLFNTSLAMAGAATVTDFTSRSATGQDHDRIALDNSNDMFAEAGPDGTLASAAFWSSATVEAHDASDRVIYNSSNGWLTYDSNGSASGGTVTHFATLQPHLVLQAADFLVV
jgi:Ca2+-binding RTX toxin-like protein